MENEEKLENNPTEKAEPIAESSKTEPKAEKPKRKKKRIKYIDDGHTVYSMENVGNRPPKGEKVGLTRKERRAVIKAAFAAYAPIFIGVLLCFTVAALLIFLWLR